MASHFVTKKLLCGGHRRTRISEVANCSGGLEPSTLVIAMHRISEVALRTGFDWLCADGSKRNGLAGNRY